MKNRKEHKRVDINYFLIPMLALSVLFFIFTYSLIQNQIKNQYEHLEDIAVKLTNSYAHSVVGQTLAADTATQLLEERLEVAMNAIILMEHHWSDDILTELGDKFYLDALYVYSPEGIIRQSMNGEYIGWIALPGHPVHDFMISGDTIRIEDIRRDTESNKYFKYGYLRTSSSEEFIQVGISAERINALLEMFSIDNAIKVIKSEAGVETLAFINLDKKIMASTDKGYVGLKIKDAESLNELLSSQIEVSRVSSDILRVFAPVNHGETNFGWLAMYWSAEETDNKVKSIIYSGIFLYLIITFVIGFILYYAYKKDKSNYKLAYYDRLTELPNRSFLIDHLTSVYDLKPASYSAFMAVNCKNLSLIISTYGYAFGDEIIKQLTKILKARIAEDDRLYRFSSDRFVVLIDYAKPIQYQMDLAKEIVQTFSQPVKFGNGQQFVSIEVAIVELDGHQKEVSQILQEASITLSYLREKNLQVGLYNAQMEAYVKNDDFIEHIIQAIIQKNPDVSMTMVYQPLVNTSEGRVIGFEALLRVSTNTGLTIPPLAIINVAEKRQLIHELGNRILFEACQFINDMNKLGIHDKRVAVNISGLQLLRDEFLDATSSIIQVCGIDPSNLEFEITESVLLENLEVINRKLNQVRNMGITIALDDFGTGYSSLSRLRELNIDIVKIDKFFIDRIEVLDYDRLISGDIISMAHKLGLVVIAEGVETQKQWQYLHDTKCDIVQGYFISKPLSHADALRILVENVSYNQ